MKQKYTNRYPFMNTYVDVLSLNETINIIDHNLQRGIKVHHTMINAHIINLMQKDEKLRNIIRNSSIISADGISVVLASKLFGVPLKERVTGPDLFSRLIALAHNAQYKIYLLGAKQEVIKKVKQVLEEEYKDIQIVGYHNGFFNEEENEKIVLDIEQSNADMLFVAFSSPKKEYWINRYFDTINVSFVMGVGGCFDIVAGVTERAPKLFRKIGMEWFYRFIQEPKRMWKRYAIGNIYYIASVIKYRLKSKVFGNRNS